MFRLVTKKKLKKEIDIKMVFLMLVSAAAGRGTVLLFVTEQVKFWLLKIFLWIHSLLCGRYLLDLTPRQFLSVGAGRKEELNERLAELNFFVKISIV